MGVILEVVYESLAGLAHDYRTQLRVGGLFAKVSVPELPPLSELTLRLSVDAAPTIEVPARFTVVAADSVCVELATAERAVLAAKLAPLVAAAGAGSVERRRVRILDGHLELACEPSAPVPPPRAAAAASVAEVAEDFDGAEAAADDIPAEFDGDESAPPETAAPPTRNERAPARSHASTDRMTGLSLERRLMAMSVSEKVQQALHGDRELRGQLLRDRAGPVQAALVRNPKCTFDEISALARSAQLSPDGAEAICAHRGWGHSAQIALALVRNPRTPIKIALSVIEHLNVSDLRVLAKATALRGPLVQAARKKLFDGR